MESHYIIVIKHPEIDGATLTIPIEIFKRNTASAELTAIFVQISHELKFFAIYRQPENIQILSICKIK